MSNPLFSEYKKLALYEVLKSVYDEYIIKAIKLIEENDIQYNNLISTFCQKYES